MPSQATVFNPRAVCNTRRLGNGSPCAVIDEFLEAPDALVELAVCHRQAFGESGHAYPGIELPLPAPVTEHFVAQIVNRAGEALGIGAVISAHGRLSMVTRPEKELRPIQCVCHRDRLFVDPGEKAVAAVLYLFRDPELGGTNFFRHLLPADAIDARMQRWAGMSVEEFAAESGQPAGYLTQSNRYFELTDVIEPRWNRLVAYDGGCFHGSHITRPELLSDQPAHGRLTLNLFLRCWTAAT